MSKLLKLEGVEETKTIEKCIDCPFSYNSVADCALSIFLTGSTDPRIRFDMRHGVHIPANCPLPDLMDAHISTHPDEADTIDSSNVTYALRKQTPEEASRYTCAGCVADDNEKLCKSLPSCIVEGMLHIFVDK